MSLCIFIFHRYGVVLRELGMKVEAREKLLKSCELAPLLWSSWQELTKLCESREMVRDILYNGIMISSFS